MAKKSSASKGYRKQHVKKPFLTKKEIILLCFIIAALIVGAVLLFTYDDGALKLVDGKPAIDGDNWLVVDGSNVRGRARYFKLGEVGNIDGFTLTSAPSLLDANVPSLTLTPDAEDAAIDSIGYTTFHNHADALVDNYVALMKSNEEYTVSEAMSGEAGGLNYRYCTYTRAYHLDEAAEEDAEAPAEAAEAAEDAADTAEAPAEAAEEVPADAAEAAPEPNRYVQAVNAYIDGAHDSSVIISVLRETESQDELLSDEAMLDYLSQAVSAVQLEAGK